MADIAARAGVTTATVSLALRGHPRISAATRDRVAAIAEELGYVPDPALAALARRRNKHLPQFKAGIAFMASEKVCEELERGEGRPTMLYLYESLTEQLSKRGYGLVLMPVPTDAESLDRRMKAIRTRNITSLVLPHPFYLPSKIIVPDELSGVALMGRHQDATRLPLVTSNHFQAMTELLLRLQERGYKRPALCLAQTSLVSGSGNQRLADRTGGLWMSAFERFGEACFPNASPLPLLLEEKHSKKTLQDWIDKHQPDVILSPNDEEVLGQIAEMKNAPDFCSLDMKDRSKGFSGYDLIREQIAATTARLIASQAFSDDLGDPVLGLTLQVPAQWVEGSSLQLSAEA